MRVDPKQWHWSEWLALMIGLHAAVGFDPDRIDWIAAELVESYFRDPSPRVSVTVRLWPRRRGGSNCA